MRYRSNNILALIPPTKEGKLLLNQSLFFQQSLGMRIFVYHIIDKPSLFEQLFHAKRANHYKSNELVKLRRFIEESIPEKSLNQFTYRIKTGDPLSVLQRQSKKGGYEFIIIDKCEQGSTLDPDDTDKLISRTFCPVMTVNRNYQINNVKRIVIPVDILQTTKKKLLWATFFAKKFDAQVTIISALTMNIDIKKSLAWRNAEKLKHMLSQRGVKCDVEILKAKGQEKHNLVLDYIAREKPELVIIRTHQESRLAGTHIGKFVSEIVHGCQMPVFTVNRFLNPTPVDFEV